MISNRPLISKSSSRCTNPLETAQEHQLQLVLSSLSCSTDFSIPLQGRGTFQILPISLRSLQVLYFLSIIIRFGRLTESGDPFVSPNPRGVCASHSRGQILGCAYTICSYSQTSTSWTVPSGSSCPPSHA